jgi:hypothetical protein
MAYAQELKIVKPYLRLRRPKNRGLPREQEDFASHPCAIEAAANWCWRKAYAPNGLGVPISPHSSSSE